MVAVKMFWDMWKNLTSATTNWSFTGGSGSDGSGGHNGSSKSKGSSKPTRYNRLESCYGPSKSQSHPVNLISFASSSSSSSSSTSSLESLGTTATSSDLTSKRKNEPTASATATNSKMEPMHTGRSVTSTGNIKHSFSSTFPLTSRAFPDLKPITPTPFSQNDGTQIMTKLIPPPPAQLPTAEVDQILNQVANEVPNRSLDDGQGSHWNQAKKDNVAPGSNDSFSSLVIEEADVGKDKDGVDQEDEDPTCEVCDRAFPTFKKLADHQRKKRHYGCDTLIPNQEALECRHQPEQQLCHQESDFDATQNGYDYDEDDDDDEDRSNSDSFQTEDDENGLGDYSDDCDDEERERLL